MAKKKPLDGRSDLWIWPVALLFTATGLGQAWWMWKHTLPDPDSLTPLTLLLWVGLAVVGLCLLIHWLARRWLPAAWVATAAWAGLPVVHDWAYRYYRSEQTQGEWLLDIAPLLFLILLGVGLGGAMVSVTGLVLRRWSGTVPVWRAWREGFFAGLFVVLCGWLLVNRVFAWFSAFLLANALLLFETFFVTREASR